MSDQAHARELDALRDLRAAVHRLQLRLEDQDIKDAPPVTRAAFLAESVKALGQLAEKARLQPAPPSPPAVKPPPRRPIPRPKP